MAIVRGRRNLKAIDTAYVCPLLIDLEPSDVGGPLAQFQATRATKDEIRKLVRTINSALGTNARPDHELDEAFEVWWPKLEGQLMQLPPEVSPPRPQRSDRELLEEVLAVVRDQARASSSNPTPNLRSPGSTATESFGATLRREVESLDGIYRAKVEVFHDRYCVSIDPDPSLAASPQSFEFLWDEEPLKSTGRRAIERIAAYLAEVKAKKLENQWSYAAEDTPDVARFRKELVDELRRRKLDFSADAAERCGMRVLDSFRH